MRAYGIIGQWVRSLLVGPLGFLLIGLGVLYIVARFRSRGRPDGVKGFGYAVMLAGLVLAFCFPYPAYLLELPLRTWAEHLPWPAVEVVPEVPVGGAARAAGRPVVLVLGGGFSGDEMLNAQSLARLEFGLQVWGMYDDAWLLFSEGGAGDWDGERWIRNYLMFRGMPGDRILLEKRAQSTRQNMVFCREILDAMDHGPVILVTSSRHVPRAYLAAKACGMAVTVLPLADPPALGCWPRWHCLLEFSAVLNEYAGLVGYFILRWI